jgi:hypothetical protein
MDGTWRISLRNRMFLRGIVPYGAAGVTLPVRMDQGPSARVVQEGQGVSTTIIGDVVEIPRDVTEEEQNEGRRRRSEKELQMEEESGLLRAWDLGGIKGRL